MRPGVAIAMAAALVETVLSGCATTGKASAAPIAPASAALGIERVRVEPKTLHLGKEGEVIFRYALTSAADVSVEIVDEEGRVLRQILTGPQATGDQAISWDGRDEEGKPVPAGVYRYVIRAEDAQGRRFVHDPSVELGADELEVRNFSWDPQTGLFRWTMPKAGHARLRIGIEGYPHLRTLIDWEPMEAGEQTLSWDGMDGSGLIRLKEHPKLLVKLVAFALAPNTVIVRGENSSKAAIPENRPASHSLKQKETAYLHARHSRPLCREVRLRVEFPSASQDAQGHPLFKPGAVPVRVTLDPADAVRMINERFEVALFEDLTVIYEEEEGLNPFTFLWDTSHLPPGQHLFTVNLLGHDDHFGVETKAVVIEGASP